MSRGAHVLLIVSLAALTALAQPGLCPCWLIQHVELYHPHPAGQANHPHSHGYLLELYQSQTPAVAPAPFLAASLFILLLASGARQWILGQPAGNRNGWSPPIDSPPPRQPALRPSA